MTASLTRIVATAYACTATGDAPALDVIPGLDGSGLEPVLSVPLQAGGSDAGDLLAANGWRTVVVATAGQLRQASPWTDAGDYAVARAEVARRIADGITRPDAVVTAPASILAVVSPEAAVTPGRLSLTVDGDEVTVTGSIKGDPTHAAVLPRPWVWSRRAGGYVLPRSLSPSTRANRIATFRTACERSGVPLEVEDAGTVQSEAARRAARVERLEVRADRHGYAAERAEAEADSRYRAFRQIADGIPMGQPILVGHHSERGHRAAIKRMDGHMNAFSAATREAERRAELAENLRRNLECGDSAVTIGNRIERNEAELRRIARRLEDADLAARVSAKTPERAAEILARTGVHVMADEHRARLEAERDRLAEAVELDKATLSARVEAGIVRMFDKTTVSKGDAVKIRGQWRRVVRANAKTVACESGYGWTDNSPWREVSDHKTSAQLLAEHRAISHADGVTCSLGDKCPLTA